ncbi:hypothetical protein BDP81DRAFT_438924 [Colletotrichum phormii]|uniref:Uncharacterized protein n=1 Tax=Colletotrichum phormii TaxID=359342 RepID=A0AAI9ZFZ1_9PEZI|nr:uncharacterized protein BDP81DRAFT_438924 [Colletotrichum phormii]KAK1623854.1 hypothetical protein BDP81DRAFT_438924 [Colletotrichum phormii]
MFDIRNWPGSPRPLVYVMCFGRFHASIHASRTCELVVPIGATHREQHTPCLSNPWPTARPLAATPWPCNDTKPNIVKWTGHEPNCKAQETAQPNPLPCSSHHEALHHDDDILFPVSHLPSLQSVTTPHPPLATFVACPDNDLSTIAAQNKRTLATP